MFHRSIAAVVAAVWVLAASGPATAGDTVYPGAHWGAFKDDGCQGKQSRQFSAILWDIPWGASWEDACRTTEAKVWGTPPTRCVNDGFHMWGEWDREDLSCP